MSAAHFKAQGIPLYFYFYESIFSPYFLQFFFLPVEGLF
jgi:hypothetical protein